jgi:signal peptidase I
MIENSQEDKPASLWTRIIFGTRPARTLVRVAVATVLIVVMFNLALMPIKVVGISMQPTYQHGAVSVVNKLAYALETPQRGDIVAIQGEEGTIYYLKRIVGMPGEEFSVKEGRVFVNGSLLREPYAEHSFIPWQIERLPLDEKEYFVIGDNRELSSFGVIREEQIVGQVLF